MNAALKQKSARQPLKLILIGTSGGGQVALGATEYLDEWLDAQIIVVSVGGVFNGINGLMRLIVFTIFGVVATGLTI